MSNPVIAPELLERKQRMLFYEGISLIVLLLLGGLALGYYVWREYCRNQQIKEFFASFSHDLRTPIASLRLQAESLSEDLKGSKSEKLVERLTKDTVRLEMGLENSMLMANIEEMGKFRFQEIRLQELICALSQSWPELTVQCEKDAVIVGDRRAVESVFKNIINNSVVHGKAQIVKIDVQSQRDNKLWIEFSDDGIGFTGNQGKLGSLFFRHTAQSGTGMGLYLVHSLMRKMHGSAEFKVDADKSMVVEIQVGGIFA